MSANKTTPNRSSSIRFTANGLRADRPDEAVDARTGPSIVFLVIGVGHFSLMASNCSASRSLFRRAQCASANASATALFQSFGWLFTFASAGPVHFLSLGNLIKSFPHFGLTAQHTIICPSFRLGHRTLHRNYSNYSGDFSIISTTFNLKISRNNTHSVRLAAYFGAIGAASRAHFLGSHELRSVRRGGDSGNVCKVHVRNRAIAKRFSLFRPAQHLYKRARALTELQCCKYLPAIIKQLPVSMPFDIWANSISCLESNQFSCSHCR